MPFWEFTPSVVNFFIQGFSSHAESIRPEKGKGSKHRGRVMGERFGGKKTCRTSQATCVGGKYLISSTCRAVPIQTEATILKKNEGTKKYINHVNGGLRPVFFSFLSHFLSGLRLPLEGDGQYEEQSECFSHFFCVCC